MRIILAILLAFCFSTASSAQQSAPPANTATQPPAATTEQAPPTSADQPPPASAAPPVAQTAPPAAASAEPARGAKRQGGQRRTANKCRQQARAAGKKGADARDYTQLCRLDTRRDCLKQAIDGKISGKARRDFIRSCVNN